MIDPASGVEVFVKPIWSDSYAEFALPADLDLGNAKGQTCLIPVKSEQRFCIIAKLPPKFDFKGEPAVAIRCIIDYGRVKTLKVVKQTQDFACSKGWKIDRYVVVNQKWGLSCRESGFQFGEADIAPTSPQLPDLQNGTLPNYVRHGRIDIMIHRGRPTPKEQCEKNWTVTTLSTVQANQAHVTRYGNSLALKMFDLGTADDPPLKHPTLRSPFHVRPGEESAPIKFTFFYRPEAYVESTLGHSIERPLAIRSSIERQTPAQCASPTHATKRKLTDADDEEALPQKHIKTEAPPDQCVSQSQSPYIPPIPLTPTTNTTFTPNRDRPSSRIDSAPEVFHNNCQDVQPHTPTSAHSSFAEQRESAKKKARLMLELEEVEARRAEVEVKKAEIEIKKQLLELEVDEVD